MHFPDIHNNSRAGDWQSELGVSDKGIFEIIWGHAIACKRLSDSNPAIGLRETLVYSGKGIAAEGRVSDPRIHSIVQYLLGRGDNITRGSVDSSLLKAILISENREFLAKMGEELRSVLHSCSQCLPPSNPGEEKLLEAFVGNVIALIPYCYPNEGDPFEIPMKIDGVWRMVSYQVDQKIELTPKAFGKAIAAYGFVSQEGPPILSFLGTTFPAGEGFIPTVLSDCTPGMSVGHAAYLFGKKKIDAWIGNKNQVHVYGMSLGGALSFQTLLRHRDRVAGVHVYNPAGLYTWDWGKERYDSGPKVEIYYQGGDVVATMGRFPTGGNVNVYRVFASKLENFAKAHARVYTGGERVTILKSDIAYEHSRIARKALTALHFITGLLLLIPAVLAVFLLVLAAAKIVVAIQERLLNRTRLV